MNPKTKTLLVIFMSFLLGCIVGASMLSGVWRSMTRHSSQRQGYRTYLYERLSLDSLQMIRTDSLLDVYRSSMNDYRNALQVSRDSLRTEIRSILTEPQQLAYDALIAEMSRRDYGRRTDSLRTK